jgi:hypothetical protein
MEHSAPIDRPSANRPSIDPPSVMAIGLKYGLFLGLISIAISLVTTMLGRNPLDSNWINMVVSLAVTVALVVLAHKNFKENNEGFMSYGQGLGIAMVAILVSIVLTGIYTFIYTKFIDPTAMDSVWEKAAADMEAKGQDEEQIETALGFAKNLFWLFFVLGGAFWGLIVGLIVSIFTQKNEPEQAF